MTQNHKEPAQTDEPVELGRYIAQRRIALDLSKSEAAKRAGVSRRTWHEVEEAQRGSSTALTLAQFDQALQLPEGTLYAMSSKSAHQQTEALRQRAIALVRSMTTNELRDFVDSNGEQSIRDMFAEIRAAIQGISDERQPARRPAAKQ